MKSYYSEDVGFYKGYSPEKLLEEFGSPLYVYSEEIFRKRCKEMGTFVSYEHFKVTYSIKANSNLELLKIARQEGLHADAFSPGEIYILKKAGYQSDEIFYISNNVSPEEMKYAVEKNIMVSVDSLSQLETFGKNFSGTKVSIRLNPGIGTGHHKKVVTGGKQTKFGINIEDIEKAKQIAQKYQVHIAGLNQHIGSLFMTGEKYIQSVNEMLSIAKRFEDLDFVDFGGGFGVPYKKQEGQKPLELESFGSKLNKIFTQWVEEYGKRIMFRCEPGRYIVAECGVLLGSVYARKKNDETIFIGTDIGFNTLVRPVMYDSHHDIEVYRNNHLLKNQEEEATIVGNICESGDIIANNRLLPKIQEGDIIGIMDAGAYGFCMASNYNSRLRPAEVLIDKNGSLKLIRSRDTFEDLIRNFM